MIDFKLGDTVMSQPIGSKDSFIGTICDKFLNGKRGVVYHVRDAFNRRWHRDASDLTLVLSA